MVRHAFGALSDHSESALVRRAWLDLSSLLRHRAISGFCSPYALGNQEQRDTMARPQAADYEERKQSIVDNAARLFAFQSFLGTSIIDIAEACEFSKSLLYHYFGSKEELLVAVMASHIDRLQEIVDEALALRGSSDAKLHTLLRMFMAEYAIAANKQKVLVNELSHLPEADRTAIVAKQRRIIDSFQALLIELDPGLSSSDPRARVKTMLLFGMINWTGNWYDPSGPIKPGEIADMAADLMFNRR